MGGALCRHLLPFVHLFGTTLVQTPCAGGDATEPKTKVCLVEVKVSPSPPGTTSIAEVVG